METMQSHPETAPIPEWKAAANEIWAMMRENAREFDRQMQEAREQMRETREQMKETDRQLGKLGNRFGEMVEYMIVPNLVGKFSELDFEFTKASTDVKIKDREHDIFLEVDAFLENGDKVMIVEIKTKPTNNDIDEHVERMEKLRKYADLRGDKRQYLGAVAGVVFSDSTKIYVLKHGFYVIEPSGDTFRITEPTGQYHSHIW